jgi:hypothetical protein
MAWRQHRSMMMDDDFNVLKLNKNFLEGINMIKCMMCPNKKGFLSVAVLLRRIIFPRHNLMPGNDPSCEYCWFRYRAKSKNSYGKTEWVLIAIPPEHVRKNHIHITGKGNKTQEVTTNEY